MERRESFHRFIYLFCMLLFSIGFPWTLLRPNVWRTQDPSWNPMQTQRTNKATNYKSHASSREFLIETHSTESGGHCSRFRGATNDDRALTKRWSSERREWERARDRGIDSHKSEWKGEREREKQQPKHVLHLIPMKETLVSLSTGKFCRFCCLFLLSIKALLVHGSHNTENAKRRDEEKTR